jgi:tetratricopeptide (TPR) repeat protein
MTLAWLNGREAAEIGAALADQFAPRTESAATGGLPAKKNAASMEKLLSRADSEVRPLQLNFYKKAKFANSFKWRLIENGVAKEIADEVTQSLIVHLSQRQMPASSQSSADSPARPDGAKAEQLFHRGNKLIEQGAYAEAVALYQESVELDPSHAAALNNLGSALLHLGRVDEAERNFREAIATKADFSDPHSNLGNLVRQKGYLAESEALLRRALKLRPNNLDARINLGLTLVMQGRVRDARACFAKVLKTAPRNLHALFGMGQLAMVEGRFEEAEATFRRVAELGPTMTNAWAALADTRKMTTADDDWLKTAEAMANSAIRPLEEANLRFAIGKYSDDVHDFDKAFQNFKRGNELLKSLADDYDRKGRSRLIDESIRVYSSDAMPKVRAAGSPSAKPVFVVGMPRSGTSLAEQIIASHPAAYGAGELDFWAVLSAKDRAQARRTLDEPALSKVAEEYLSILEGFSGSASRAVDKAPVNSDFLGLIYSVFPNAHVIYMQRDPIDTCLSCYFQQFLTGTGMSFAFDLSDLVHYYREHQRIMAHWRAVLPPGFILEVPYVELVKDQETWSRRMLDFIGLEWDPRVLEFHTNKRQVTTASAWQVRQRVYKSSVARWRNYEKYIGPLKALGK